MEAHITRTTEAHTPLGRRELLRASFAIEQGTQRLDTDGAATLCDCDGSDVLPPGRVSRLFDIVVDRKRNAGGSVLAVRIYPDTKRRNRLAFEKPSFDEVSGRDGQPDQP